MKKLKRKILNLILKNLFNAITDDDILKNDGKGGYKLRNGGISNQQKHSYGTQARAIKEQPIWTLLNNHIKWASNQRMYEKSKDIDDLVFGKATLYAIDLLKRKVDEISKW